MFQHPMVSELIDGDFLPVMCYNASDKFVSILLIALFLCTQISLFDLGKYELGGILPNFDA